MVEVTHSMASLRAAGLSDAALDQEVSDPTHQEGEPLCLPGQPCPPRPDSARRALNLNDGKKTLNTKEYVCPLCGETHVCPKMAGQDTVCPFTPPMSPGLGMDEEQAAMLEQALDIKAKNMYDMVEEFETDHGEMKLLFLTNSQAQMLADIGDFGKLLDAFGLEKPSLVLNLQQSFLEILSPGAYDINMTSPGGVGMVPFASAAERRSTEQQLDRFMSDVVIPLAAQTNAIILCMASTECSLAASLMRVTNILKSKWGSSPPFTILNLPALSIDLLDNQDDEAHWREIERLSKNWRLRSLLMREAYTADYDAADRVSSRADIHSACTNLIMVDAIDGITKRFDGRPRTHLINSLISSFSHTLPSLTIKTGNTLFLSLAHGPSSCSSLVHPLYVVNSGAPVLALDLRHRKEMSHHGGNDRESYIDEAKGTFLEDAKKLMGANAAESLHFCSIAYFWRALFGQPDLDPLATAVLRHSNMSSNQAKEKQGFWKKSRKGPPGTRSALFEEITAMEAVAQPGLQDSDDGGVSKQTGMQKANDDQVAEVSQWLANHVADTIWSCLPDKSAREEKGESYEMVLAKEIYSLATWTRCLLTSRNFYAANVFDLNGSRAVIEMLIRQNGLPKHTPLEGLVLLRGAWREFDVTFHLASRYKILSKLLFIVQLLISWAVVVASFPLHSIPDSSCLSNGGASIAAGDVLSDDLVNCIREVAENAQSSKNLAADEAQFAFGLSIAASFLNGLEKFLNPKERWRRLKFSALSMEATIWKYRTRVGEFKVPSESSQVAEENMRKALIKWREELVDGGDLQVTALGRSYPARIFKHHQFSECGPLSAKANDDFHSPVHPDTYVKLRLEPIGALYRSRIPRYSGLRYFFAALVIICTLVSTVLIKYEQNFWVVVVTSGSSAIISWKEYANHGSKIERLTNAIFELSNLNTWWESLSEVEKSSQEVISKLVDEGEGIICRERSTWLSSFGKNKSASFGKTTQAMGQEMAIKVSETPKGKQVHSIKK
jgi:hypothetical protein